MKIISKITYLGHKPFQIIYASQPFGYDSTLLSTILEESRRCNSRDSISGALVSRQDIYIQLLEGSMEAVDAAYGRICCDDRRVGIKQFVRRRVSRRFFGKWAMLHDPEISLIWSQQQIKDGVLARISQAEIIGMFKSISIRSDLENFDH